MRAFIHLSSLLLLGVALSSQARIDLVTLPARDQVQLTIYNAADLTLVREQRTLTLRKGLNRLEFGWEQTLIDPSSIRLTAPRNAGQVRLLEVSYPPRIKGSAVWSIESDIEGAVPVEISYFTSGISWRAFHMATLGPDERHMTLRSYINISNHSGEEYAHAHTRVVVGSIHLLDQIAALARRQQAYGRPGNVLPGSSPGALMKAGGKLRRKAFTAMDRAVEEAEALAVPKAIVKQGLSEYFLYSIEGAETIANGWGKRLPAFTQERIPVVNLYRYEESRYGKEPHRLLRFRNDSKHGLGKEPIPDGGVKVFRRIDMAGHLQFSGSVQVKYIPVDQEVELDLGKAVDVSIEPLMMAERQRHFLFDRDGNISGFDRLQQWRIRVENNRDLPVEIEVWRDLGDPYWSLSNRSDNPGQYLKVDARKIKYKLHLDANSKATLAYTLTRYEGERRNRRPGE